MVDAPVSILDRGVVRPRSPQRSPNCGIVLYPPGATLGPRIQMDYQLVQAFRVEDLISLLANMRRDLVAP